MRPPTIPTVIAVGPDDNKQTVTMKTLYNTLVEYREPKTHRILIQLFMCLPSRKDFPAYYNIIERPIAMNRIRERIEQQQYVDENACFDDFKLMFSNCKFFNEDDSQIYKDAVTLEAVLKKKRDTLLSAHYKANNREAVDMDQSEPVNHNFKNSPTGGDSTSHTSNSSNNAATHHNNNINNNSSNGPSSSPAKGAASNSMNANSTNNSTNAATNNSSTTNSNNNLNNNNNNSNYNHTSDTNNHHSSNSTSTSNHRNSTRDEHNNHANEHNGTNQSFSGSIKVNHNHHNDTSMDSSSNLSADLLASTPVEKCSLNTRRGRNADAPKRQLLTGYIIYASEIRKQVIDKNPNQNFGDISRLVGNEWKALPHDIRSKYDQRALIHNKRVRERAQRDNLNNSGLSSNGLHTPKMTKRKLAKLAKEQMKQHHLSIANHDDSSIQSPRISQEHTSSASVSQPTNSNYKQNLQNQHSHHQPQIHPHASASHKTVTTDSSTQTAAIRFVEPPARKRLAYSEAFKRYIEGLEIPNRESLVEETVPDRPVEVPTSWLGAGVGRHESPEAALWALRDFMLQDAVTMRRSMEPYL